MQMLKYPLMMTNNPQTVAMPTGARFRHFAIQNRIPTIWAEATLGRAVASMIVVIVGTGMLVPENARYLMTAIDERTGYVWHLYGIDAD